jgi:hypothetical protein
VAKNVDPHIRYTSNSETMTSLGSARMTGRLQE